tara:strand:- start:2218 stop:2676 length:459 start_codon:yes stop_codon:yes gene_type:complete
MNHKTKRNTIYEIDLLNGDSVKIKPYSVTKLFSVRKVQREINALARQIEEVQKEIYELDENGNLLDVASDVSAEREEEVEDRVAELQRQQINVSVDMCLDAVVGSKNKESVTTEYILDNLDMSGISEMTSFITGGDAALAEFFRTLTTGGEA